MQEMWTIHTKSLVVKLCVDTLWIQLITGAHFSEHNFKVHTQAACRIKLGISFSR